MRLQLVVAAAAASSAFACSSESRPHDELATIDLELGAFAPSKATHAEAAKTKLKAGAVCARHETSVLGVSDRIDTRPDLLEARGRISNAPLTTFDKEAMKRAYVLPCVPKVDLAKPGENPENVQLIMTVFPETRFQELMTFLGTKETGPMDVTSFSYLNFLRAAARMPYFCGEAGTFHDVASACRREIAALFAHGAQETGAHDASSKTPEHLQVFAHVRETNSYETNSALYDPGTAGSPAKCVAPFVCPTSAHYYGRGLVQLTHFYNYAAFSAAFLGDAQVLLNDPDRVAREGYLAIASAIWFHMTPRPPTPSSHDVLVGRYRPTGGSAGIDVDPDGTVHDRFEATVSIVNGAKECSAPPGSAFQTSSMNRFKYYGALLSYVGAEKTQFEASYTASAECKISAGNPWSSAPIKFAPDWYFDTVEGTCTAVSYEPAVALPLVTEGMQRVCKKLALSRKIAPSDLQRTVWRSSIK